VLSEYCTEGDGDGDLERCGEVAERGGRGEQGPTTARRRARFDQL